MKIRSSTLLGPIILKVILLPHTSGKAKGYEIHTSARKDSIEENMGKGKRWGVPMVWVAEDKKVLEELSKSAGIEDGYMEIK